MTRSLLSLAVVALALFACVACVDAKRSGSANAGAAPPAQPTDSWLFESEAVPQGAFNDNINATNGWTLYKQCGESWSNDRIGTSSSTICQVGCAMSSVAMILRSRGTNVNPGSLNTWLQGHGGYVSGNLLVWGAVNAFGTIKMANYFKGAGSLSMSALAAYANRGAGVVVNVRNGGHWVLVTAKSGGNNFAVNDPGFNVNEYGYEQMSNFVVYESA